MATVLRFGPGDHGRPLTFDEFQAAEYEEGYRYELIEGGLYVSPMPNFPHDWIEQFIFEELKRYSADAPHVINKVTNNARVFVPDDDGLTASEPDVAAYAGFPLDRGWRLDWKDVSPLLVVEILGGGDEEKNLVRNVDLYGRIPSIREYWVLDIRRDPGRPLLKVFRRENDARWRELEIDAAAAYTTPLLPGFTLPVAPPPGG